MKKTLLFIVFVFTIRTCFSITINDLTQDLTDLVAEGRGVLLPDENANYVEQRGVLHISQAPNEIINFLTKDNDNFYSLYLSYDELSKNILFFNSSTNLIYSVSTLPNSSTNWTSVLFPNTSELNKANRIHAKWKFYDDNFYFSSQQTNITQQRSTTYSLNDENTQTNIYKFGFSSINVNGDFVSLGVTNASTNDIPYNLVDIYIKTNLNSSSWNYFNSYTLTNSEIVVNISRASLGYTNALESIHIHDSFCQSTTNIVMSPIDESVYYTNIIWNCSNYENIIPESCFFNLGTRHDFDSDGLSDAFELLVTHSSTNSLDSDNDSISDYWEYLHGMNLTDYYDSLEDFDYDGIPNIYEYKNNLNPNVDNWDIAPKIIVSPHSVYSTNGNVIVCPSIREAFNISTPYSIVVLEDGLYEESFCFFPEHPILLTSSNRGKSRGAHLLNRSRDLSIFVLGDNQNTHTIVQGLILDIQGESDFQFGVWLGDGKIVEYKGSGGLFKNVYFMLGGTKSCGAYILGHSTNEVIFSSCVFDASKATDPRGIYAIYSPQITLENCSFINFPPITNNVSYGMQLESYNYMGSTNCYPAVENVILRNTLFDSSFSNCYALTRLENYMLYNVTMENCIIPSELDFSADINHNVTITNAMTTYTGHLLENSPAINQGSFTLLSSTDIDSEKRINEPDIGADEYNTQQDIDSDGDSVSNWDEIFLYNSHPYIADSDYDYVNDFIEIDNGTEPFNHKSYCFIANISITNSIFLHPNLIGRLIGISNQHTNTLYTFNLSPSNYVYKLTSPIICVTNAPLLYVELFSDANTNGVNDILLEDSFKTLFKITNYVNDVNVKITNTSFDMDDDSIPNYWELAHGLNPNDDSDVYFDNDNDGLNNLYEYLYDLNPNLYDGTNTVVSIISRGIDNLISNHTFSTNSLPIYQNYLQNGVNKQFVRNPYCWANSLSFSANSTWNSEWNNKRTGTLITPIHFIQAEHFPINSNKKIYFCGESGTIYERIVVNSIKIYDPETGNKTDISVGLLNEPVPEYDFVFPKVLPNNYKNYLHDGECLPIICLDQEKKAIVRELTGLHSHGENTSHKTPTDITLSNYSETIVGGDSGNPLFLMFDNELILLAVHFYSNYGNSLIVFKNEILSAINQLTPETSYQLQEVDFSGFMEIRK